MKRHENETLGKKSIIYYFHFDYLTFGQTAHLQYSSVDQRISNVRLYVMLYILFNNWLLSILIKSFVTALRKIKNNKGMEKLVRKLAYGWQ